MFTLVRRDSHNFRVTVGPVTFRATVMEEGGGKLFVKLAPGVYVDSETFRPLCQEIRRIVREES